MKKQLLLCAILLTISTGTFASEKKKNGDKTSKIKKKDKKSDLIHSSLENFTRHYNLSGCLHSYESKDQENQQ